MAPHRPAGHAAEHGVARSFNAPTPARSPHQVLAGAALLALAGALLLAGGGLAPPLIGSLLGLTWLLVRRRGVPRPGRFRRRLARVWRLALVVSAACYLALFPGTVLLHWWFGVNSAALVAVLGLGAFAGLFVLLPAAVAADRLEETQP